MSLQTPDLQWAPCVRTPAQTWISARLPGELSEHHLWPYREQRTRYWKDLLRQQGFVAIIFSVRCWNKSQWSSSRFYISVNTVTFKAMLNFLRATDKQISLKIWPTWISIYNLTNSVLKSAFPSPFFINLLAFFAGNLKWPNAQTTHGVSALTCSPPFLPVPEVRLIPTFTSNYFDSNNFPDVGNEEYNF